MPVSIQDALPLHTAVKTSFGLGFIIGYERLGNIVTRYLIAFDFHKPAATHGYPTAWAYYPEQIELFSNEGNTVL